MNNLKRVATGITLASLAVFSLPLNVFGVWGPERPEYENGPNGGADHVVFNSMKDNPNLGGHEKDFVGGRVNGTNGIYNNVINDVKAGDEFQIRMYVHNNANADQICANEPDKFVVPYTVNGQNYEGLQCGKSIAKNTKGFFSIPSTYGKSLEVQGQVYADNANNDGKGEKLVWDSVTFNSSENFSIVYVPGSATFKNNQSASAVALNDSVTKTAGALLGYNSYNPGTKQYNGDYYGCYGYDGYATITVRIQTNIQVEKTVRLDSDTEWSESVKANPGEKVWYQIMVKNNTAFDVDLLVRDVLPAGMVYVQDSAILYNATNPNGLTLDATGQSHLFSEGGMHAGGYTPGSNLYLRFAATAPAENSLRCGDNVLENLGLARADHDGTDFGTIQDTANVEMSRVCKEDPCVTNPEDPTCKPVDELPTTGPAEVVSGIIGLGAVATATTYYVISSRQLKTKVGKK